MLKLVIYVVLLGGMHVSNTHACICIIVRTLGDVTHSLAPSNINLTTKICPSIASIGSRNVLTPQV